MGNPTEKLRAKLDELGVEYDTFDTISMQNTYWNVGELRFRYCERKGGMTELTMFAECGIAPEQAIAATVGEEHEMHICKRCGVAYELSIIDKGFGKPRFCPNCGYREMYQ